MTRIERYKRAKNVADSLKKKVDCAFGKDSGDNDKHRVMVSFLKLANDHFSPMIFSIGASYGYCGNSSGYSATSSELGNYLAKAIQEKSEELFQRAVQLAETDEEICLIEAEEEAKSVLKSLDDLKGI